MMIVRHPPARVWTTIRDRLPELIPMLDDIEEVLVEARREERDGTVRIVNTWKAKPQIPSVLASIIRAEILAWTDRAEWRPGSLECHWRIEPHFHPERTRCHGITRYEQAIGGGGTRVTFEGVLEVSAASHSGISAFLQQSTLRAVESFVTGLIPKNFQKLVRAAAELLAGEEAELSSR